MKYCLVNKSYIGCDLPKLNVDFASEKNGDYDEEIVQNANELKNSFETACSDNDCSNSGVAQIAGDENGSGFENEVEFCEGFVKSVGFNSKDVGENLRKQQNSENEGQEEVEIREDDVDEASGTVDERRSKIAFEPKPLSLDDTDRSLVDREMETAVGISGSKRETKNACEVVHGTDGSSRDIDGSSRDTDGSSRDTGGSSRDTDGPSRDNDGSSRDTGGTSRDTGCIFMEDGGTYVDNRDIKGPEDKIPLPCVAERVDYHSESSDEDLEEIVYKGEME